MSSERERTVEKRIRAAGVTPTFVHIGRGDDVPSAKFRVGQTYKTIIGDGDSDDDAADDIVRQAKALGIESPTA